MKETQRRGIFVQLEFWDRWNESGDSRRPRFGWYDSPWNPNNNVNYDWSDSPLLKPGPTGFYNPFHLAAVTRDPALLPLQQRFVRKILDEVIDGGFDHVLFQVDNESGIGDATLEPDPYWARFARRYAQSKGWRIFVCTQRRFHPPCPYRTNWFRDWNNPEVRVPVTNDAFNYCDISQNNGTTGQEHYDNILWFRAKVQQHGGPWPVNNVKAYHFNWPIGAEFRDRTHGTDAEAGARLWRAVFAGVASFRFHRDTPRVPATAPRHGLGLSPLAKRHLRSLASFLRSVNLFALTPRNDLLSDRTSNEAYCLAQPGRQYAVFFTGDGDRAVGLDVSGTSGRLTLQWLDVAHTSWTQSATLEPDTRVRLAAPRDGHWVAVLRVETER